jgi:DNA-binding Xre family transcriptional regulator
LFDFCFLSDIIELQQQLHGGKHMSLRYYKLFDLLQRQGMKKGELMEKTGLSWPTMAKLSKGDVMTTEVLNRICAALDVQPGDIMEYAGDGDEG